MRFADKNGWSYTVREPQLSPRVRTKRFQEYGDNFSTKRAEGRGPGTYSMKFFAERHLGAEVFFTSSKDEGTTFTVSLPL